MYLARNVRRIVWPSRQAGRALPPRARTNRATEAPKAADLAALRLVFAA
jgi:hypothetical protein